MTTPEDDPHLRVTSDDQTLVDPPSAGSGAPGTRPAGSAADDGFDLTGALRDRYRLVSLLGKGGFGIVYLAHDRILDQDVAIKVLKFGLSSENDRQRFIFEARTGAKLRHPAIVNVFDILQTDEGLQLIMEYYPGGTLSQLIKREGRLDSRRALEYTRQIATGLAYAHKKQIIHRDIKPANVFIAGDDIVKLGDFGIATNTELHEHTATGEIMGTPLYMAPEQTRNSKDVDPRSDLFALGMTLYHMLTGKPPRVVDLEALDFPLRDLIRGVTSYERKDRPVSAEQFIALIDKTLLALDRPNQADAPSATPTTKPIYESTGTADTRSILPPTATPTSTPTPTTVPMSQTGVPYEGYDEATMTHRPAPVVHPAPAPSGGMGWSVVALVGVLFAGFLGVIYMIQSKQQVPVAGAPTATATPPPEAETKKSPGRDVIAQATPPREATPMATPKPTESATAPSTPIPSPVPMRSEPSVPPAPSRPMTQNPARPTPSPPEAPMPSLDDFLKDRDKANAPGEAALTRGVKFLEDAIKSPVAQREFNLKGAIENLGAAAKDQPRDAATLYLFALALRAHGEHPLADEQLKRVRTINPDFESHAAQRLTARLPSLLPPSLAERFQQLAGGR